MRIDHLSRKIGLAVTGGNDATVNLEDVLARALSEPVDRRAPASIRLDTSEILPWPQHLTFSLRDRIDRLIQHREKKDALERQGLNDTQLGLRQQELDREYSVFHLDIYRFFHAGRFGTDDVRQRLSYFWLNHFTVGAKETTPELIGDYWDNVITSGLDGSFADLLYSATKHPAMLTYLDNIYNIGGNSPKARECSQADCVIGLNDNLGRELMELHSVSPARGYSETDINEAAKVLAGWGNIFDKPFRAPPADYYSPWEAYHSEPGEKTVLGKIIPEGPNGLRVLTDRLASDNFTADFLSRKLVQHFVGEPTSEADVVRVRDVWLATGGRLPDVHREVLLIAAESPTKKFLWPLIWAFQVQRMSGATLAKGIDEIDTEMMDDAERDPKWLMGELGNSFWSERQPNGFSDRKSDWISTEHLDRRIRFASLVHDHGQMERSADEIITEQGLSEATAALVAKGGTPRDKFVLLMCSPEVMEV